MSKKEEEKEDTTDSLSSRFFELERIVKSTGLKLADDWGLLFMRPLKEHMDELFLDLQLAMVLLLHMTWQIPHGFSLEPKRMAESLAPHGITKKEILRVLEKMEKVGLVEKEESGALKGFYLLIRDAFALRVGKALGFEEEIKERRREAEAKKMREIVRKVRAKK